MIKISAKSIYLSLIVYLILKSSPIHASDYKAYGFIQPETSIFFNGKGRHGQKNTNLSIFGKGTFISYLQNDAAKFSINILGRYDDNDRELRYLDFQKLKYEYFLDDLEFKIGNDIIFWGVNETFNIVDIINQSNLAEELAGTKKLGQTMASLSYSHDYGKFDIYLMSNFQERSFSGKNGRPRLAMEIDKNTVTYESSAKDKKVDFAIRYSTVLDDLDIGLSHFYGNNRTPELKPNSSTLKFDPFYPILSQTGLDIQSTKGSWLYKLESISAKNGNERHLSAAGGIEYTFYGIQNTQSDLGIIIEYIFDDRNNSPLNNDGVIGLRWNKNDIKSTTFLAGLLIDLHGNSNRLQAEFEQRIADDLKLFVDFSLNGNINRGDFAYQFIEDSKMTLKIAKYF